jgi:hypothetical protein
MPEAAQPDCLTAFLVIQASDGAWYATPHLQDATPMHKATVDDMKAGCTEVAEDMYASKVASVVVGQMLQATTKIREQAMRDDLNAQLRT